MGSQPPRLDGAATDSPGTSVDTGAVDSRRS
jgi:hypothetical protein